MPDFLDRTEERIQVKVQDRLRCGRFPGARGSKSGHF